MVDGLATQHPFFFSVSMTTRPARPDEIDGVDYHFVDAETFEQAVERGDFVEWAEYGGHLYGTPSLPLEQALSAGKDAVLDIEIVGSRNVKERFPEAILIWIDAPDRGERERRLRSRGDTSDSDVARRLEAGDRHSEEARGLFDHFVVNDSLSSAIDRVADILDHVPQPPLDTS